MKKLTVIRLTVLVLAIVYVCFGLYVVSTPDAMPKLLSCILFLLGIIGLGVHLTMVCLRGIRTDREMTERRRDYERSKIGL